MSAVDLELSDDQRAMVAGARGYLSERYPPEVIRRLRDRGRGGFDAGLWRELCEQGWLGMAFPECHGGGGASLFDLGLFCAEAGRVLLPGPFAGALHAGLLITELGTAAQVERLLPALVAGEVLATPAMAEPGAHHWRRGVATTTTTTTTTDRDDGWTLSGQKCFVPDAGSADQLIVIARAGADGLAAFLVPGSAPGVSISEQITIGRDRQCRVALREVTVEESALLGATTDRHQVEAALVRADDVMTALSAMEMVGGAQRVLEMTVDYVSGRTQFDRPIGSFQAVQHSCADMAISVHGARLAALQALWLVSERRPASRELAIAKSAANDTYVGLTLTAHQLHGGMGITREHDLHLWSEQARAASLRLGTSDHHLDAIAARLTSPGQLPDPTASGLVGG